MRWQTHSLLGINSLWLLDLLSLDITQGHLGAAAACAGLAALLPDLDACESKIKHLRLAGIKPFSPLSTALHQGLGHRGLTHSLLGLYLVTIGALALILWWGWLPSVTLVLGYASHLVADACTRSGIPLLYPNPQRVHLLPRLLRIKTGSLVEDVLSLLLAFTMLLLFLTQLSFMPA